MSVFQHDTCMCMRVCVYISLNCYDLLCCCVIDCIQIITIFDEKQIFLKMADMVAVVAGIANIRMAVCV